MFLHITGKIEKINTIQLDSSINTVSSTRINYYLLNYYLRSTYSAGKHHDLGNMLYSLANILSIRLRFLANRSFRQISLMPGKWLIFYNKKQYLFDSILSYFTKFYKSLKCKGILINQFI